MLDFDEVKQSLSQKKQAADTWAEHFITFDEIVHNSNAIAKVCAALGLSPPSEEQERRMISERQMDAKTGAARVAVA